MKFIPVWFLVLIFLSFGASAESELRYNRVSFSVSAESEVENDRLVARLFAEERGRDTKVLAKKVNEAITWGLDIAKKQTEVEAFTLNYSTNPEYKEGKVVGWRVRQSIQLKSDDSQVLSQLLGELQNKLSIESVEYQVSSKLRKATEETLIAEGLQKFKQRADQVTKNMGRSSYKVVNLNVSNSFSARPPYPMAMQRGGYAMKADMAPPSLTAGKQQIVVNVQAEIELAEN